MSLFCFVVDALNIIIEEHLRSISLLEFSVIRVQSDVQIGFE